MTGIEIRPVLGIPEVRPGADLGALIAACAPDLRTGDVVVVTQKIVSKAEGRLVRSPTDEAGRESARQAAVLDEAVRVVARRGPTVITETRHGFVLAASGVDASNVARDEIALLPLDPDASAAGIRAGLRAEAGVDVAVIVSDTFGRPWRNGLTDVAIGAAGIEALRDYRGHTDGHGNLLAMTEVAVVDELAAAAELVMGKTDGVPVAVVSRFGYAPNDLGVRPLIRRAGDDMFRLGTNEAKRAAVTDRRSVRSFLPVEVDDVALRRAVEAAVTAPAPHHTSPWRFVVVADTGRRARLLAAMRGAWADDLRGDGYDDKAIERRIRRGDLLQTAPALVVPCFVPEGMHVYPDRRRLACEREMFMIAMGAGVENFLVALAAEGFGSCWIGSTIFCKPVARRELDLPDEWEPMGAVAIGVPAAPPGPRPVRDVDGFLLRR